MSRRLRSALAGAAPASAPPGPMPAPMPGALVLDLVAALVQSGSPPPAALRSVAVALQGAGDPRGDELLAAAGRLAMPGAPGDSGSDVHEVGGAGSSGTGRSDSDGPVLLSDPGRLAAVLEEALWLATRSGLPPTALIQRAAVEERRRQAAAGLRAVRRLEVLLMVPAGLCLLPAFIVLGIVPVVLDLILG